MGEPQPMYTYIRYAVAGLSLVISMFFVYRSFYGMRIGTAATDAH